MKIIADLPEYIVDQIRDLVLQGKIESISKFLLFSAENQLALEKEAFDEPHIRPSKSVDFSSLQADIRIGQDAIEGDIPTVSPFARKDKSIWDLWIWGQVNRLLPVKYAARLLAAESAGQTDLPTLEHFREDASLKARLVGQSLEERDDAAKHSRDRRLSTGFPIGKNPDKSFNRFSNHFIGAVDSQGRAYGALFELGFAGLQQGAGKQTRIGLTHQGAEFARLPNPVFDELPANGSLGNVEVEFYLQHIVSNVPGETAAFSLLMGFISKGIDRRPAMNRELSRSAAGSGWNEGVVSTQRSGALARMYEQGLVDKTRDGLEVIYSLTERAEHWLREIRASD